jgi:anti-repressor protein
MIEPKIFRSEKFGAIRTIEESGKVLFVASDIARVFGYVNTSKAIADHCRHITKRYIPHPQNPEKQIEVNVIEKSDIFRLAAKSELDGAEEFESWIFDEVIPKVTETGLYVATSVSSLALADAILKSMHEQDERVKALESSNKQLVGTVMAIREAVTYRPDTWREDINRMINRIALHAGNAKAFESIRKSLYEQLENRAACDLERRLDNYKARLLKEGASKTNLLKANKLDTIDQDKRLREIFLSIIREAVIAYGCESEAS